MSPVRPSARCRNVRAARSWLIDTAPSEDLSPISAGPNGTDSYMRYTPGTASQKRASTMNRVLATGRAESRLLADLERQEIPVLSLKKHRALLGDIDDQTLYDLLTQLQGKGWLLRIEQGTYVVVPRAARRTWHEHPFIIAAAMAPDPYYISYWSALSFHNLTTQMPPLVSKGWRKQDLYTSIRAKEADWDGSVGAC